MPHYHRAYGLNIYSDIELLPLPDLPPHNSVDVKIKRNDMLIDHYVDDKGVYQTIELDSGFVVYFPGIAAFRIRNGDEIEFQSMTNDLQSVRLYLLGSCIAGIWYQRSAYILHANVINIDGKAVAIAANSGAGKSTLAAQFYMSGFQILSDDVCVIDDKLNVQPGYPYIKLWESTLRQFSMPLDECIQIRLQQDKYYYPIRQAFYDQPLQLQGVYILRKEEKMNTVKSRPIKGIAKMRALKYHSYRSTYLNNMESHIQRKYWNDLLKISKNLPVTLLGRPEKGFHSMELLKYIVNDLRNQTR